MADLSIWDILLFSLIGIVLLRSWASGITASDSGEVQRLRSRMDKLNRRMSLILQELNIELDEFDVVLKDFGSNKLEVVKALRDLTGSSLMEIKSLVESSPVAVIEDVSEDEARRWKVELEQAGAIIEVLPVGSRKRARFT